MDDGWMAGLTGECVFDKYLRVSDGIWFPCCECKSGFTSMRNDCVVQEENALFLKCNNIAEVNMILNSGY